MEAIAARATESGPPNEKAVAGQFLTFMSSGEQFAVSILLIKEIIEFGVVTEVPMMPAFIRGVINLRGRVVPVVDLAARFGRKATDVGRRTCIVIVETGAKGISGDQQDLGIMVDAVNEVIEIGDDDIEPAPAFGARLRPEFIAGMAKRGERFVIMLELDRVLSIEDMSALGPMSAEGVSLPMAVN